MKKQSRKYSHLSIVYPHYEKPFPNSAEPQYYLDKLIDAALAVATGMGAMTIMFFLVIL